MSTEQLLLLFGGQGILVLVGVLLVAEGASEGSGKLAGAALQHSRDGGSGAGLGDGGNFGHEVEVEQLHDLDLYLSGRRSGLEQGCDGEKAVESLEGAGVLRHVDEGGDKHDDGSQLDGGAVNRLQEVKQKLEGYELVSKQRESGEAQDWVNGARER